MSTQGDRIVVYSLINAIGLMMANFRVETSYIAWPRWSASYGRTFTQHAQNAQHGQHEYETTHAIEQKSLLNQSKIEHGICDRLNDLPALVQLAMPIMAAFV